MSTVTTSVQPTTRHQVIEANVVRACPRCQAPGLWQRESEAFAKWGSVCVPAGSPLIGKPVGAVCPQCGFQRNQLKAEPVRVLVDQWTFGSKFQIWKFKLNRFLKGLVK